MSFQSMKRQAATGTILENKIAQKKNRLPLLHGDKKYVQYILAKKNFLHKNLHTITDRHLNIITHILTKANIPGEMINLLKF